MQSPTVADAESRIRSELRRKFMRSEHRAVRKDSIRHAVRRCPSVTKLDILANPSRRPLQTIMKSRRELDLELVKAAQAGDVRAFDTLIRRYRTRLTRYLSTILRDQSECEDVAQEAFIKAYMALHSFRAESSFATWFFRIGINIAKRTLVRNSLHFPKAVEPSGEHNGNQQLAAAQMDFDTPEAKLETKQIFEQLNRALDALPEEQRTALVLRELDGLSYEEIAEKMHTPVGTVRSRIHRARDTIAATLASG